ncbi:MAG: hypothetical protein Q4C01_06680 [Clostridia bacterium]|nr:hypothetical protein [Clostridia bacterium]
MEERRRFLCLTITAIICTLVGLVAKLLGYLDSWLYVAVAYAAGAALGDLFCGLEMSWILSWIIAHRQAGREVDEEYGTDANIAYLAGGGGVGYLAAKLIKLLFRLTLLAFVIAGVAICLPFRAIVSLVNGIRGR